VSPLPGATCWRLPLVWLRVAAAALLSAAVSQAAPASELQPVDTPFCNLLLQGEIADGDAESFKAAVERTAKMLDERLELRAQAEMYNLKMGAPAPPNSLEAEVKQKLFRPMKVEETAYEEYQSKEFATPVLPGEANIVHVCLNSGGGSFAEAQKIIEYMTSGPGVATIVRAGDECYSACALIFMFGNIRTFGENRFIDRRLDVRGKLGFHAPYVTADAVVPEEVVAKAYQSGIQAVANLLELDRKGFLNRALVVDFLRMGPGTFLNLDTVGKAGEWVVELIGYALPEEVTGTMLDQACGNDIEWTARRRTSSSPSDLPSHYDLTGNWLKGKAPPEVFPVSRLLEIDATRLLFTRPASEKENEKTDSICCVVKLQKYQSRPHPLALHIEHEKVFNEQSVCQQRAKPASFSVPNQRPLVGAEGFTGTLPAWFIYPPSTPLASIAVH
jgi:hypothetical protein